MKTSELIGAALDWAVAKIENPEWWDNGYMDGDPEAALDMDDGETYNPSTDWAQGGPIIEREGISFRQYRNSKSSNDGIWYARVCTEGGTLIGWYRTTGHQMIGPTPLIAAMRCYVALKLGDEVEIPEELKC
jgi:hypothetical protein